MFRKVHPGTETSSDSGRGGGGAVLPLTLGGLCAALFTKPLLQTCLIVSPILQTGCDGSSFVDGLIDNDENVGSASFKKKYTQFTNRYQN